MTTKQTQTIPEVEESQLLVERFEAAEVELEAIDQEVGRLNAQLKTARKLQTAKLAQLRGVARARSEEHPLLDEEEADEDASLSGDRDE